MLIKLDNHNFPTEAATAATVLSCLHSYEAKRRLDNVTALVGRHAR
jgi:hypothetical protein